MQGYGQYCPVAIAAEVLGERWTILILRELLLGSRRFGEIERGLPGISRALLAKRLATLSGQGLVTKADASGGYALTEAGEALRGPIDALGDWAARSVFGDPRRDQVRPDLLMWWMRRSVRREHVPQARFVVRFEMRGPKADSYWLLAERGEVELCIEPPTPVEDLVISGDATALHRVYAGRLSFAQALREGTITVQSAAGAPRPLPRWLGISRFAEAASEAVGRVG